MATFKFHIDQKETIWRRNYAQVEADTEEEAILKMRELVNSMDYDLGVYNSELILETSEDMNYYDNLNNPTTMYLDIRYIFLMCVHIQVLNIPDIIFYRSLYRKSYGLSQMVQNQDCGIFP